MSDVINWFAIPSKDLKRAVKFYSTIFAKDIPITSMGGEDMAFFPMDGDRGVGGHIFSREGFNTSTDGPILYLNGGDNLQDVLDRIEKAGGKITIPKTQITPEIGFFAMFIDSEGNRMALHSPH
jgi:predicted enzyme related to lactoylglutathione lyase